MSQKPRSNLFPQEVAQIPGSSFHPQDPLFHQVLQFPLAKSVWSHPGKPAPNPVSQNFLLPRVEGLFQGKSYDKQESILRSWVELSDREIPDLGRAREIWEQDPGDRDAKAWRETSHTLEWETELLAKTANAEKDWHDHHPIRSFLIDKRLQDKPPALESLEQEHSQMKHFVASSQEHLDKLEHSWSARQPEYEQKLENEGRQIEEARENLKVIEANPEYFKEVFTREHNQFQERIQQKLSRSAAQREPPSRSEKTPEREPDKKLERDRDQGHDRDDGWSR